MHCCQLRDMEIEWQQYQQRKHKPLSMSVWGVSRECIDLGWDIWTEQVNGLVIALRHGEKNYISFISFYIHGWEPTRYKEKCRCRITWHRSIQKDLMGANFSWCKAKLLLKTDRCGRQLLWLPYAPRGTKRTTWPEMMAQGWQLFCHLKTQSLLVRITDSACFFVQKQEQYTVQYNTTLFYYASHTQQNLVSRWGLGKCITI